MNIYLVSQNSNNDWDTFDSFVCYAPDEETARIMLPNKEICPTENYWNKDGKHDNKYSTWAFTIESVSVKLIGSNLEIKKPDVILASFNAG